jgi:hypothetical protein
VASQSLHWTWLNTQNNTTTFVTILVLHI